MPAPIGFRKVTLNLLDMDCMFLENHFGHGWSVEVRGLVHEFATKLHNQNLEHSLNMDAATYQKMKLGDLE